MRTTELFATASIPADRLAPLPPLLFDVSLPADTSREPTIGTAARTAGAVTAAEGAIVSGGLLRALATPLDGLGGVRRIGKEALYSGELGWGDPPPPSGPVAPEWRSISAAFRALRLASIIEGEAVGRFSKGTKT